VSNKPKQRPARAAAANRTADLRFDFRIAPPDGDRTPEGVPVPVDLVVDLRRFTLGERDLAMRALTKMADPNDWVDWCVVHAWVVWRRSHPASSLQVWMDHIEWGAVLDGLAFDTIPAGFDTVPEGFDPKV